MRSRICAFLIILTGFGCLIWAGTRHYGNTEARQTAQSFLQTVVQRNLTALPADFAEMPRVRILQVLQRDGHAHVTASISTRSQSVQTELILRKRAGQQWEVLGVAQAELHDRSPSAETPATSNAVASEATPPRPFNPALPLDQALQTAFEDRPEVAVQRY